MADNLERISMLFENIEIKFGWIFFGIMLTVAIGIITAMMILEFKYPQLAKRSRAKVAPIIISAGAYLLCLFSVTALICLTATYAKAKTHGYFKDANVTVAELWKGIHGTPEQSDIPSDIETRTQCLILYFKFGCPDCAATHKDIEAAVGHLDDTYWVSSRSDIGRKLLEKYPVPEVPSAVYIKKDGTYLTYILYKSTDNGPVVNDEALTELLNAINYDRR